MAPAPFISLCENLQEQVKSMIAQELPLSTRIINPSMGLKAG